MQYAQLGDPVRRTMAYATLWWPPWRYTPEMRFGAGADMGMQISAQNAVNAVTIFGRVISMGVGYAT